MKSSEKQVLEEFKIEFEKLKQMGFIDSRRFHDTGIGKTAEDLLGVIENNKDSADYKGVIELKSARELSQAMVTLFTKSPNPRGVNSIIRETFGYFDEEFRDSKILHTTFSADKFNTSKGKFGFLLDISKAEEKIFIKIKNLEQDTIDASITAFYPFEKLREIVEHKCKYIIFISAERKKQNGKEMFRFNKAVLLSGLTFDKFLDFTKQGIIKYDFRLGVYRKTKNPKLIGKNHDHGSGFRINKNNLSKVFSITELD
ncbi:MAG: hypothetical protein KJ718_03955 [Nanoarchaeota archaeon]|nr:hypothetical protein [Nanoarchaeota archaeon]